MSDLAAPHILLVGCGKMGSALLKGLSRDRAEAVGSEVVIVDPAIPNENPLAKINRCASFSDIPPGFTPDIVVLAVKPQNMQEVVPAYATFARSAVFLSIAAGMTLARIEKMLGCDSSAIVRAMPNLPASIGQGVSVAVANAKASKTQRDLCELVLRGAGAVEWVEDEKLIDAVTALSGSGPAYVFALAEAMAQAGAALGLPGDMAQRLARHTIEGSGALLARSQESAEALRRAVTSKGGTTEAALAHMLAPKCGLPSLMMQAMRAAAIRARELAKE